jgi:ankyrin repeat protein
LYQACAANHLVAVEALIQAGAQVDLANNENITPLMIAAYNGHLQVCEMLINLGRANVHHRDRSGKTALVLASYEGHAPVVRLLLAHGADVNNTDSYGWTALMLAAYAGRYEVCKVLLDHHADPSVATSNGKNAYILAREAGYDDVVALLARYQHATTSEVTISMHDHAMPQSTLAPPSSMQTTSQYIQASSVIQGGASDVTGIPSVLSQRTGAGGPGRATMGRAPRRTTKRRGLQSKRLRKNVPDFTQAPSGMLSALEAQTNYPHMAYTQSTSSSSWIGCGAW